ncbi:MAG TPA: alginate lyase family protein [Bryobacteraceae bacterium]|nr:alginate lyase family protein [Bryobacteraceae bacterium]
MRAVILCILLAVPVAAQPRLLLQADDFTRINEVAASRRWAADARASIIRVAQEWPQAHLTRYGLQELALPPEGGQWTLWYVCPVHGVGLQYTAPNTHTCPVDKKTLSGWPYDQVIYARRHSELAGAARDNALAFRLTGGQTYAAAAAWILKQYAGRYLTYPLKDVNNRITNSAARASAQTLDEAAWLIPLAWSYDLLSGTDVLSASERADIENNLLRPAATVIQRNDAGISNWQSWHNAAIGAVGFALEDGALINAAVDGRSGFRFQMSNSVIGEGFWYEGAWGYHFYALDPLVQLAGMAAQHGIDLWSVPGLRGMFSVPLELTFADGALPALNDSRPQSLFDHARLYEHAYARFGDPLFAAVAGRRSRGRDALLWGAADLPDASLAELGARVFPDSGYAVLRAPQGDHTVTMKFGPHGGWHGHYDKLGFVSFALGGILGVDPGTQSYAAPTHNTWDKETVAHNTVVLDERSQSPATGKLLWQDLTDQYSAASADAGPVYSNATLERTLLVTREYALDLFKVRTTDGSTHRIDWVYHNSGELTPALDVSAYDGFGKSGGYQHLSGNRAAVSDSDWTAVFDASAKTPATYSSVYASSPNVSGRFEYSADQASSGRVSGRLSYDFRGDGYLLFSAPVVKQLPAVVPSGLKLMLFGDGSGHRLSMRLNDATDERFTIGVGPINWHGWKEVEVRQPSTWSHYLGNNDGIVDLPIRSVTLEVGRVAGSRETGSLYADDISVLFPEDAPVVVADFELPVRRLRVWMLGEPGTTVITGDGLGPDLLKPVPFVMARRSAAATEFATLLEPWSDAPRVVAFGRGPDGEFVVQGGDFEDRFRLGATGVIDYQRR